MKKMKNCLAIIFVLIIAMMSFTGCTKPQSNPGVSNNEIGGASDPVYMTIESMDVTLSDLYLYSLLYVFNNEIKAEQINDATKAELLNKVVDQIKLELVEYKLATVSDITLDDTDAANVILRADGFISYFGEDFLGKYGVNRANVEKMFERQAYIEKLQAKSMQDLKNDYLEQFNEDYKDMVFFSVYYVLFPTTKYDENGNSILDENGDVIEMSEDEKAEQLALANELRDKALANVENGLSDGGMELLASEYGVAFASGTERNYKGAYIDELNAVIDQLNDGDISEVVETPAGYMVVRMDNANDEEFKNYMIDGIASQSAEALYPTLQENWITGSGVQSIIGDQNVLISVDILTLCQDMNARGFSINGGMISE